MSKKAHLFLFGYLASMLLFALILLFFTQSSKDYEDLQLFVHLSGVGDAAFYSDEPVVRFYSLLSSEALCDDPFLPPRCKADFIYRMRK